MLENSHLADELARLKKLDRSKYTTAQIAAIDAAISAAEKAIVRGASIAARKTRQQRADDDKRARWLGHRLQLIAEQDKRAKAMLEMLLSDLPEPERYLFPERWPDAPRPEKPTMKGDNS
jgi:hypothetical protein